MSQIFQENLLFFFRKKDTTDFLKSEKPFLRETKLKDISLEVKKFVCEKNIPHISLGNLRYLFLDFSNKRYFSGSKNHRLYFTGLPFIFRSKVGKLICFIIS